MKLTIVISIISCILAILSGSLGYSNQSILVFLIYLSGLYYSENKTKKNTWTILVPWVLVNGSAIIILKQYHAIIIFFSPFISIAIIPILRVNDKYRRTLATIFVLASVISIAISQASWASLYRNKTQTFSNLYASIVFRNENTLLNHLVNSNTYNIINLWSIDCAPCIKELHIWKNIEYCSLRSNIVNLSMVHLPFRKTKNTEVDYNLLKFNFKPKNNFLLSNNVGDTLKHLNLSGIPAFLIVHNDKVLLSEHTYFSSLSIKHSKQTLQNFFHEKDSSFSKCLSII